MDKFFLSGLYLNRFLCLAIGISVAVSSITVHAQFTETTDQFGIVLYNSNPLYGNGSCFVDFDGDGWEDLTLAAKNQTVKFYKNNNGFFSSYNMSFTPTLPVNVDVKCPLWVDYDNDGDKDFILTGAFMPMRIYNNNGSMVFTDVALAAGIPSESALCIGVSAGDFNNDGCLDLFACKYHNHLLFTTYPYSNHIYQNNCDGTFTDITMSCGIGQHIQASFCCVWLDYNMDGFQDIYVVNDKYSYPNYLYKNNGDGTFSDVTETSGAGIYIEAMSATCGDYDHDDDFDIFVSNTNITPQMEYNSNYLMNYDSETETFTNVGTEAGVLSEEVCWGSLWIDYDNDTWEDLFVGNLGSGITTQAQNNFFVNNGDGTFHDGIVESGMSGNIDGTYTAAMGDYNHDGYYDFITNNLFPSNASLYRNNGGTNNWVSVSVEGTVSNRDGIGTWIECYSGGNKYRYYTFCGENYMCQNSEREIFGLGTETTVDSLKLQWLSGLVETYYDVAINAHHHYIEGQSFIGVPAEINYSDSLNNCSGNSITLTAPEAPEYLWSTGDTTQSIVVTHTGEYYVDLPLDYGFVQNSDTLEIFFNDPPSVIETVTATSCFGGSNGTSSLSIDNGTIDSVTWSNEASGASISGLSAGIYTYVLINSNNCVSNGEIEILQPTQLTVDLSTTDLNCFGDSTGTVAVIISGGTPDYQTDWLGADPNQLFAGIYEVSISDVMNCTLDTTYQIFQPDQIMLDVLLTDVSCFGFEDGSATWTITGGTPGFTELFSGDDPDSLAAGNYSIQITDSLNCSIVQEFFISEPNELLITVDVTPQFENGDGGTAELTITGGISPYSIFWSTSDEDVSFINGLDSGMYYVEVMDSNSCTTSVNFEIQYVVSITEIDAVEQWIVYPNPTNGILYIQHNSTSEMVSITITDATGKLCMALQNRINQNELQLDLSDLPAGVYDIRIITKDHPDVIRKCILK